MADEVVRTVFQFLNDKQATNQLLRDNKRIDDSLEAIDGSADQVTDAYSDMEDAARRAAKANRDAAEAGVKAAKEQSELVGDVASRTGQLSGALSGLGAVGGQRLMIVTDILDAAEAAQLMRAEFPAMISKMGEMRGELLAMGAVGGALALVTVAASKYNEMKDKEREKLEASREALAKYVDTLLNLNLLLLEGDAEGLEDALDNAEDTLAALRTTRSDVEAEFNRIIEDTENAIREMMPDISDEQITRLSEAFLGLGDVPLFGEDARLFRELSFFQVASDEASIQARVLNDQIGDLDTQIEDAGTNIETTTGKIEQFNAATSEAENSLENVTDLINDKYKPAVDGLSDSLDIDTGPSEELLAMQDNYNKILEDQEADALAAAAALFNLDEELENVGTSFEDIEAGAKAIAQAEVDRAAIIAETEQSILDITAEGSAKRVALENETAAEIDKLEDKRDADLVANAIEHDEKVTQIKADFQEQQTQDLQDFQRDQRRAEAKHRDSILESAGELDAIGILNEQRSFETGQKQAKVDFKVEQKRKEKDFKAELKAEDLAFKKEQQQTQRNFRARETELRNHLNRQLAAESIARNQEIAKLRGHQAQRLAEIDSALETELRKLTGFTEDETEIRDEHYVQMLDQLQLFVDEANAIASGLGSGGAVGSPAIPNTTGAVGQFPLSAGVRSPGGIASPFASPMAMMPPVSRSQSSSTRSAQVTNNFSGMDRLSPGQIRNVVKIINNEMLGALT